MTEQATQEAPVEKTVEDNTREIFDRIVAAENEAEKETEALEESAPVEEETPTEETESESEESSEAKSYLRLKVGAPESTLDSMDEADLLKWEKKVRANERDVADKLQDRAGLEKRLAELEAKAATSVEVQEDPAPVVDLAPAKAKLREELGEAGADSTIEVFEGLLAPVLKRLELAEKENESNRTQQLEDVVNRERKRLAKGHELLGVNEAAWESVQVRAGANLQSGAFQGGIPEALEHAAEEIFGKPEEKPKGPSNAQKNASKPTSASGKSLKEATLTQEKQRRMVFDYIEANPQATREEKRRYGEALQRRVKK